MKKKTQEKLKHDHESLVEEFNNVLKAKGYPSLEIKHFSLLDTKEGFINKNRRCVKWRRIFNPNTGVSYLVCVKYADQA